MRKLTDAELEIIVQEAIDDLVKHREHAQKLISNDEYMRWLEKFTLSYPRFSDDDWLYCPERLTEEDYNKVQELQYFYNGLVNYDNTKVIPVECEFWNTKVIVKFNSISYEISLMVGQGSVISVKRCEISPDEPFIDFNDCLVNN